MCGLAGFAGTGTADDIRSMTSRLVHRGPDDEAYLVDHKQAIFLGFRRLIIIDAEDGAQPMVSLDDSLAVVFNGEIYNHAGLRRELEAAGRRFRSDHSDTEVLLHGYAEWGEDLPLHLDGMFAFAIWDRERRRIFCARDRFGEKPFYYAARPGLFAFASEIRALHAHSSVSDSFDPTNVQKFFAYGYVPAPRTIYKFTRKLEPGGTLVFDMADGSLRARRYWRFAIEAEADAPAEKIPLLAEELRELLKVAVNRRLQADVPLGVFLSGGVDSSAILAFAAQSRCELGIDSFTIGFAEPSYDESHYARMVAASIGSRHHERVVGLELAIHELPALLGKLDEPFADPSVLPTYMLARFAREHVTVALSGDGGDELFAGYDPFSALRPASLYRRMVPASLHRVIQTLAERLPRSSRNMSFDYRLRRALRGVSHPASLWNPIWLGPLATEQFVHCFEDPLPVEHLFEEAIASWTASPSENLVDRSLEFYTNFYLPEMILAKADRASMHASLESRAPFLDPDVVAFCQRLPHGYKMRRGQKKFLLKQALRGVLPDSVLARPKKGFGIPLTDWLADLESPDAVDPIGMRAGYAAARWQAFRNKTEDERLFLWGHLCLARLAST
jgi:asparagine synthase (glutamine-hydrolysing)